MADQVNPPPEAPATLTEQITTKLAALGNSANAVATSLEAAGITGRRGSATSCPIANYLGHAGLGIDRAYVGCLNIDVRVGSQPVSVPPPAGAADFIRAFDRGEFADLEWAAAPGGEDQ